MRSTASDSAQGSRAELREKKYTNVKKTTGCSLRVVTQCLKRIIARVMVVVGLNINK